MSRHSHWAKIKRGKGNADADRGVLFSKHARLITVASREGGADPSFNFKLRLAVDRAKGDGMAKDAIERAISRGAGGGEALAMETVVYEGFAPGGAAVLVECVTDNRNRALNEVKGAFRDHGTSLGSEGSVRWQFQQRGVIRAALAAEQRGSRAREQTELQLIEAGAEDIREEDGEITVLTGIGDLQRAKEAAERLGLTVSDAGLEWVARQTTDVPEADRQKLEAFLGDLDELDDVQDVYTNARGY